MSHDATRPWWLRKRLLLPLLLLILIAATFAVALARSNTSTIVVYNMSRETLPPLLLRACQQRRTFPSMPEEQSVRFRLADAGEPGAIELELATDPPWRWQGAFIAPRGGFRVTLRLWPERQVEVHTQISIWQRLFKGTPNIDE